MPSLEHIADLWISRTPADPERLAAARQAVAHLRPAVAVTGGSRGLGLALAAQFARQGRYVAIIARDEATAKEAATKLSARTFRPVIVIAADVTQADAASLLEQTLAAHGYYCDVLINNAGVGAAGLFTGNGNQDLTRLLDLNVTALTRLTHHFLPGMLARRSGGILNVASLGGAGPGPGQAAYYATKAYVLSLSEALTSECAGQGVRITALAPGPLNTAFHNDMGAEGSLYRHLLPAVSLERTARAAYWGFLLGRVLVVPGLINRITYTALRFLPHPVTAPFVRILLRKRPT